MANRQKGNRKIVVDSKTYRWYVFDNSEGEGAWTIPVTSDDDWQRQIDFPLTEIGIASAIEAGAVFPIPDAFNTTIKLRSQSEIQAEERNCRRHTDFQSVSRPNTPRKLPSLSITIYAS